MQLIVSIQQSRTLGKVGSESKSVVWNCVRHYDSRIFEGKLSYSYTFLLLLLGVYVVQKTYLCEVMTMDFPDMITRDNEFHNILRATGSIPDEGSSKKINGGSPHKAMAVLNFRLLPPLKKLEDLRVVLYCNRFYIFL